MTHPAALPFLLAGFAMGLSAYAAILDRLWRADGRVLLAGERVRLWIMIGFASWALILAFTSLTR